MGAPACGTLLDLWHNQTKPSRNAYSAFFRHLAYTDGTTGVFVLTGIPTGTRVGVKGRAVRTDGDGRIMPRRRWLFEGVSSGCCFPDALT